MCRSLLALHVILLNSQKKSRSLLYDEFKKQMATLLGQWENDIERVKESEEKLSVSCGQDYSNLQRL